MIDLYKEYAENVFSLICDVNEREIGAQISDDNLKAWCASWQCAMTRACAKLISDVAMQKRQYEHAHHPLASAGEKGD